MLESPELPTMIAQTIQLALTPVFALVAIASIMNILSMRLGRVVDRSRMLLGRHVDTVGAEHDDVVREMRSADRRIALIGQSLALLVGSSLLIGLTVVLLFLQEITRTPLPLPVAATFLAGIILLLVALVLFLRETREAAAALRIPRTFLEEDRTL